MSQSSSPENSTYDQFPTADTVVDEITRSPLMPAPILPQITERLADFCVTTKYEDLPHEVIAEAKKAIFDWLGVALIGSREESTRIILKACANSESGAN